jgi:menaquinone-dependent protoporphyrinogen oxidase
MSSVLVAYGTKHGATREIAEAIADEIKRAGHAVDCTVADAVRGVDDYDAAVIGSAVYIKRWRSDARRLLKRNAKALASRPLWVFSSGPCGEKPDPRWSEPGKIVAQAERLGAREHVVFGGRLPVEPANFMERAMVNGCPPEHRDLRNWDEIRAWGARIGTQLKGDTAESRGPLSGHASSA